MSLIYHVYDPDDEKSKRHSAGAQIIGPNGEYIYKESRKVRENFKAEGHELALQLEFDTAVKKPKIDEIWSEMGLRALCLNPEF